MLPRRWPAQTLLRIGLLLLIATLGVASSAHAEGDQGEHAEHGATEHGDEHAAVEHGGAHEINWSHGFVGEKEGVEPSLLWRAPGTPAPVLAMLLNTAILVLLIYRFARKPIRDGLHNRKQRILQGMEEASRIRKEAAEQLAQYEQKLERIDEEIERVRREMREAAEAERVRILEEAKERRTRMERDAKHLIAQEMSATREELLRETAAAALTSAEEILKQQATSSDHERLAEQFVGDLAQSQTMLAGTR